MFCVLTISKSQSLPYTPSLACQSISWRCEPPSLGQHPLIFVKNIKIGSGLIIKNNEENLKMIRYPYLVVPTTVRGRMKLGLYSFFLSLYGSYLYVFLANFKANCTRSSSANKERNAIQKIRDCWLYTFQISVL